MGTILLAEPDETLRRHLQSRLEAFGQEVVAVGTGIAAFDVIEMGGVDYLLASIVLHGMDGIELVKRAEEIGWLGPVMFITGFAAVPLRRGVGDPRTRRLEKPIHLRDVPEVVARALRAAVAVEF